MTTGRRQQPTLDSAKVRLTRLRATLADAGLDGLVVTHLPNVRYLSGFTGSAGVLAVLPERALLVTDARYRIQAREEVRQTCPPRSKVCIARGDALFACGKLLEGRQRLRLGFERETLSVAALERLKGAAGGRVAWKGASGLVEGLRAVKDADEIERLRAAARLGSKVFARVLPLIKPGVRENELAAEIEYQMRRSGAEGPSFETIVASGPRTALPHARPGDRRLRKNELVLLDWGAILRGYCCDLTRTVFLGTSRSSTGLRRWYAAVLEAQQAALECARPGASGQEVDAAARRVLRRARLGRYFTHSTGHGLGLEIHEEPRLARGQHSRLAPGNVITVEPGVYVEGIGGIRIEDDVLITSGGAEVLTSAPREFLLP